MNIGKQHSDEKQNLKEILFTNVPYNKIVKTVKTAN